jgi:hypothetical protein
MQGWTKVVRPGLAGLVVMAATAWASAPGAGAVERSAPPAAAEEAEEEEHCVLVVLDQGPDGELRTADPVCGPTRPGALQRVGTATLLADFPIGVHYDGAGFTGSSVTVMGSGCTGGWLNLPGSWNDRISSTLHGCPTIRHYQHVYLTPPSVTTWSPGGNLGSLSNEVSSIQYLP